MADLTALDLFSCIGCHAIGFERAGIRPIAFCEINPRRQREIERLFPGTPIYDDVRALPPTKADVVFGGPPCQRTSVAAAIHGRRTGDSLWPYMLCAGLDAGAEWIVVEQPPGNKAWETKVSHHLSRAGYHVARLVFGAEDVGAPYPRRRVYIVACASLSRLEIAWQSLPRAIDETKRAADARGDWDPDQLASISVDARSAGEHVPEFSRERIERIEALGDSNPPGMAEVIARCIVSSYQDGPRPCAAQPNTRGGE